MCTAKFIRTVIFASSFACIASCGHRETPAVQSASPDQTSGDNNINALRSMDVTRLFDWLAEEHEIVTLADGSWEDGEGSRIQLEEDTIRIGDLDPSHPGMEAVFIIRSNDGGNHDRFDVAIAGLEDSRAMLRDSGHDWSEGSAASSLTVKNGLIEVISQEVGEGDAACCPSEVWQRLFEVKDMALVETSSRMLKKVTEE